MVAFCSNRASFALMKMNKAKRVCVALLAIGVGSSTLLAQVEPTEVPAGLIEQLGADQFDLRKGAYAELKKWSKEHIEIAPELLHKAWQASNQPEAKSRCYELMKESAVSRKFGRGKGFVGIMMDAMIIGGRALPNQGDVVPNANPNALQRGIRIAQVLPKTPAQKAGLKAGDVIMGIDKLDFNELPEKNQRFDARSVFQDYVKSKQPDDVITLHLLRDGKKIDQEVTLMKRPASADASLFGREEDMERREADLYFEQWLEGMGKNGK